MNLAFIISLLMQLVLQSPQKGDYERILFVGSDSIVATRYYAEPLLRITQGDLPETRIMFLGWQEEADMGDYITNMEFDLIVMIMPASGDVIEAISEYKRIIDPANQTNTRVVIFGNCYERVLADHFSVEWLMAGEGKNNAANLIDLIYPGVIKNLYLPMVSR